MIRFGVIGTNFITVQLLESVKNLADFTLSAVYSRKEEQRRSLLQSMGWRLPIRTLRKWQKVIRSMRLI